MGRMEKVCKSVALEMGQFEFGRVDTFEIQGNKPEEDDSTNEMFQDWGPILLDNSQLAIDDSEEGEVELVTQVGEGDGVVEPKPTSNKAGSKDFPCEKCTKVYKSKQSLGQHNTFHLKKIPFRCDVCNKAFSRKHHLKTHQKLHLHGVEREFSCNQCSEKFNNINHLRVHLETAHPTPSTSRDEPTKETKSQYSFALTKTT
ncbi:hypothetical protein QZH41_009983 [Actinostola sp. cb2023]|nr:hypothetical protein QZH41_009983 [Actinostola sp. cb2023]